MKTNVYILGPILFSAACAPAVPYTELDTTEPTSGYGSDAVDVSDNEHIVGTAGGLRTTRAAEFRGIDRIQLLPVLEGYAYCRAVAVTDGGMIAGTCFNGAYPSAGFFAESSEAAVQLIPVTPDYASSVTDMNDHGVVVLTGTHKDDAAPQKSWIYDTASARLTELPTLPNAQAMATAINDAGVVAGTMYTPSASGSGYTPQVVQWAGDTLAIISVVTPAARSNMRVEAINNQGAMISSDGLYWSSATAEPELLAGPDLNWVFGVITSGMNDAGWIVGHANYTPYPSDTTYPLGVAWTPERRVIVLGEWIEAKAINNQGIVVGRNRNLRAIRISLESALTETK